MTWHDDLAAHIADTFPAPEGVVWETGRNVIIGPPNDDESTDDLCIGLVARPGPVDETYTMVYGRPNMTLVVRSDPQKSGVASKLIQDLFVYLTRVANLQIGQTMFLRLEPIAWPDYLRTDSKMRQDFTGEIGVWLDGQ